MWDAMARGEPGEIVGYRCKLQNATQREKKSEK